MPGHPQGVDPRLAALGEVFIPTEPGEKRVTRPRTPDTLASADDDVFRAYLDAGHGYAIACQGDVAVLDADDPDALAPLLDRLPDTIWQVTGSREGEHYFLRVPGLASDIPLDDPATGENIGHVKGAPQSYVIGPGSKHPSGNRYGPLRGVSVATVSEHRLRELCAPYTDAVCAGIRTATATTLRRFDVDDCTLSAVIEPMLRDRGSRPTPTDETDPWTPTDDRVRLDCHDIVSRASCPEDTRTDHPFHDSETGENFMIDAGAETFRCWRHGCTGNAAHLLGIEQGVIACGAWSGTGLDAQTWREIFDAGRAAGYEIPDPEPTVNDDVPDGDRGEANPPRCGGCNSPLPRRTAVDGNPALRWCSTCRVNRTRDEVIVRE